MKDEIQVRPARPNDTDGILRVQNGLLLNNKRPPYKNGFIVHPVKDEELKKLIRDKHKFLFVAENNDTIVGYALAYSLEEWRKNKPDWDAALAADDTTRERLFDGSTLYFRHIARAEQHPGVGNQLEERVYAQAKKYGFNKVVGEILEKPILNHKSKSVHQQRGYKRIGAVNYSDGNTWGLYAKALKEHPSRTT